MSTYFKNKESNYSYCYYEKPSFFNYDNLGYDSKETRAKLVSRNKYNKEGWRISEPFLSETERKFILLAEKWKDETGFYSTTQQKVYNMHYLTIISMGEDVLPYILKDLKNGGTWQWHTALSILAGSNPFIHNISNPKKIKEHWIKWGESQNLI